MNNSPFDPRLVFRLQFISRLIAVIVIAIGGLTIAGWLFGIETLKSVVPGQSIMKFNIALAVVLAGIGLLNVNQRPRIAQTAALFVILLGLLTLSQYLFGWNLGIDQFFISDPASTPWPGRMSAITAFNLTLVGVALFSFASSRLYTVAQIATFSALIVAMIVFLGYAYGAEVLYGIFWFPLVSLQSAVSFVLLCTGIVLAIPGRGPLRLLTFADVGGYTARRFLPIVILAPMLFGWLRWQGELAGLYDTEFGLALFTLSNILVLSVVTIWLGYSIHAIDVERMTLLNTSRQTHVELEIKVRQRTHDLQQTNQAFEKEIAQRKRTETQFRTLLESAPDATVIVNQRGEILLVNHQTEKIFGYSSAELVGKPVETLMPAAFKDRHTTHRADYTAAPRIREMGVGLELYALRKDGSQFPVEIKLSPIQLDGEMLIFSSIRDITERKQAEVALRNSEEQFRATFDFAAIGMALVSLEGKWLKVNPAICEIVGYSQQELLTLTFQQITHPDDLDIDLNYVKQMIENKIQTYSMEKRYFHKAGHIVWVLLSVSLVRDNLGKPMYFVSQIQNITSRKAAEESLHRSYEEEREFQRQLKALHEISIELTLIDDLDQFYQRAVELGVKRLGYERLGLLLYDKTQDQAIGTYGTDAQGNVVAEDHLRFDPGELTSILRRALHEKERFVVDENTQLFSNFKPIGMGWNAVAVLWNGRENTGWLAADNGVEHKPVTNTMLEILALYGLTLGTLLVQKQTRAALAAHEALLRTVLENLPVGVWIIDRAGKIMQGNSMAYEIWQGIPPYVSVGEYGAYRAWWTDTEKEIQPHEWGAARAIIKGETLLNQEIEIEDSLGTHKFLLSSAVPLRDNEQHITGAVVVSQDITNIKQAQLTLHRLNNQLQEANQEIQQFAYIVSHDLRAPLINLKGFSEILRTSVEQLQSLSETIKPVLDPTQNQLWQTATEEKIPMAVRFISTAVERMDHFTAAILKLSRLEHRQLTYEPIQVDELVEQILQSLLPEGGAQEIEVIVEPLPNVEADRMALDQIFGNIITNAIKYLDPHRQGQIVISGKQDELQTTFRITDNGRGIAETQHDKIFAPFRRGIGDVEGEGMGLAYVQALVKRHMGRIWFESTADVGTTFSFTIPQRKASPDGSAERSNNSAR